MKRGVNKRPASSGFAVSRGKKGEGISYFLEKCWIDLEQKISKKYPDVIL